MMSPTLLLVISCLGGLEAVQWILNEQIETTSHVCLGGNVNLGWEVTTEQGEVIDDIKWSFTPTGASNSSIIAHYYTDNFRTFTSVGDRLDRQGTGVVLSGATLDDAGEYEVEVTARQTTGSFFTIRRHVTLAVIDPATYRSNRLTLQITKQVIPDVRVQLTCGPFAWTGDPPVSVIWKIPSGAEQISSYFQNGAFYLSLTSPPQSGVYTCLLAPSSHETLCLKHGDPILQEASLQVDGDDDRFTLFKQNGQPQDPDSQDQPQFNSQDQPQFNSQDQLEQCCNTLLKHVNFHARVDFTIEVSNKNRVIFEDVISNDGSAFNGDTGTFTAPLAGLYFFAVTVAPDTPGFKADCVLIAAGQPMAWAKSSYTEWKDMSTMQVSLHLDRWGEVWVQSEGERNQFNSYSIFTGFLMTPDL